MSIDFLLPRPDSLQRRDGFFPLTADTAVFAAGAAQPVAGLLRDCVLPATGFALPTAGQSGAGVITLSLDPDLGIDTEAYRLSVSTDEVTIEAVDRRGLIWGVQTLRQLLPSEIFSREQVTGVEWSVPAVAIDDAPRFGWRGTMIDVGRWFMPLDFLFRFVDLASLHKLNVVHIHLTEDQGWRFEVAKYPRLTEIGAWRSESMRGHYRDQNFDGTRHGGFYTQDELRRLVSYADARGITLVPEVDMPGHMQAAIAAYPELGNNPDQQLDVRTRWGISKHVLNVEDATIRFVQDILDEVLDVFPGEFVHIGGDECPKDEWRASELAQARIAREGLADEDALQSWFIRQLDRYLESHGRRLIGWDEILEGGLAPEATVMSWRGEAGGIEAAKAAHDVVMAPNTYTYFDYYQAEPTDQEPVAIGGLVTLEQVYGYEPVPDELMGDHTQRVLGTQCQLWTEYLPEPANVEYMAYPRTCALAEVAWGPSRKSYDDFRARLGGHLARLDQLDVGYRPL